jgi:hypothetical protein
MASEADSSSGYVSHNTPANRYDMALGKVLRSLDDPEMPMESKRTGSLFDWLKGYMAETSKKVASSSRYHMLQKDNG